MKFVEIAGLAGVGKSTVTGRLCAHHNAVRGIPFATPHWTDKLQHLPYCVRNALSMRLPLLALRQGADGFTAEHAKKLLYLNGWHRLLRRYAVGDHRAVIMDQGPLFCMAALHAFGPRFVRNDHYESWWQKTQDQWAHFLDAIVWLDCPKDELFHRINGRVTQHEMKGRSRDEVFAFLDRYEAAYEEVLARFAQYPDVRVVTLHVQDDNASQVAHEISQLWARQTNLPPYRLPRNLWDVC